MKRFVKSLFVPHRAFKLGCELAEQYAGFEYRELDAKNKWVHRALVRLNRLANRKKAFRHDCKNIRVGEVFEFSCALETYGNVQVAR